MRSRMLAAVAALALPITLFVPSADAQVERAAAAVFPATVIGEDFPDPDVFERNGTWYAYSTNNGRGHVPVATAPGPNGPWTIRGDAMPGGPSASWAQSGRTWAPDVHPNPDGSFTLTYTAWHKASGRQCIGVATSGSALGPFTPAGGQPMICPLDQGGAIDANTFVANDGVRYLAWKNDGNAIGRPSTLWLTRTANNGTALTGGNTAMLTSSGVIEAPDLVQRGSQFVLLYSSGGYTDCNYQTSYATAPSLNGPWTNAFRPLMTTATMDNRVCGPGGADFVGNKVFLHGWVNGSRHLYVADLGWANDLPVVRGSRVRTEAERGTLNRASVRTGAAGASGGAVAAYIDYADSWVQVSVFAAAAGSHTLSVGYANGMGSTASHGVVVNGNSQGSVSYPAAGWDNWRQASVPITLNAGWNTVRLTKGTLFAEVDYVEVQ
ncbi:family 43 glycosylhydrolase [Kribbella sp. CA-293567]|uniref:family 43 glycosylhydrolase n=1 Tax=Kribbella sp. CA-293567 TaxID=3002436 RepID=UPI0022DCFF62|nr:family 43 glycosylhydrolase [Kribbella sp. CA-293567]WBQ02426.1 family 43 glycosylhydrolase [Kribbella sp. CA-293567]